MENILETSNDFISKHFGRAEKKKISAFMQAFQQGGFHTGFYDFDCDLEGYVISALNEAS